MGVGNIDGAGGEFQTQALRRGLGGKSIELEMKRIFGIAFFVDSSDRRSKVCHCISIRECLFNSQSFGLINGSTPHQA